MANRHKVQRASGGRVFYAGGNSNVAKDAAKRKSGGKVVSMDGEKSKPRLDKRARGGKVGADKSPFSSAKGGGGGADKSPFSSAKC